MPRFQSVNSDIRLIPLPWHLPLQRWPSDYLVALPRGISRHVVRFIRVNSEVYAAKELAEPLAIHEYRMLADLGRLDDLAVEPVAVVTDRRTLEGRPLDPVLVTRHLHFSLPYRSLFSSGVRPEMVGRLLDALVVLLVRLHLLGFAWGDVSLSNTLFRRDAGEFAAYLVDAETGQLYNNLSAGQRAQDLDIAMTNLLGEFSDLRAGKMLDEALDPVAMVQSIETRYHNLWNELTGIEEFDGTDTYRIENRVRRLNALGFDVAELDITANNNRIRIQPKVVDAGHHSRRLMRLTGLDTEENQARRLLNDLDTYRFHTNQQHVEESIVAHQWLTRCFEPVVMAVPPELAGKRDPAQIFHEVLDYRWFQSQREHREVPLLDATRGYIRDVLAVLPDEAIATEPGGYVSRSEPEESPPEDDDDYAVDENQFADTLDIDALRRQQDA